MADQWRTWPGELPVLDVAPCGAALVVAPHPDDEVLGDPLAETPEDSLACLTGTSMHALVRPPYLIRKRDEPPLRSREAESAS